ncbi:chemotaxis response regulator protein-glutamate methylesterase [bacterium]
MGSNSKIRVLVIDDSAVVRQTLSDLLASDRGIEVIGTAADPYIAVQKMKEEAPDVITLDIEMPRMDGLTFLQKVMSQHPIPTVIVSSLTQKGADATIRALEYGAVEIVTKPKLGARQFLEESRTLICDAVKAASKAQISNIILAQKVEQKLSADVILQKPKYQHIIKTTDKVVVIGASTGGTEAIRKFLESFPPDAPGMAIVQHMPENFTSAFARRLNESCDMTVKEAQNGDSIIQGIALIAPGNKHMLVKRSGTRYYVEVREGPLVNRHRPSVDVLFRSAARYAAANAVGVIMTGMGDDGARGMLEMKNAGAQTIAQDEKSCVVFGMPNEAIKLDAAHHIVNLENIPKKVIQLL